MFILSLPSRFSWEGDFEAEMDPAKHPKERQKPLLTHTNAGRKQMKSKLAS
jgi:hypothetical protein